MIMQTTPHGSLENFLLPKICPDKRTDGQLKT